MFLDVSLRIYFHFNNMFLILLFYFMILMKKIPLLEERFHEQLPSHSYFKVVNFLLNHSTILCSQLENTVSNVYQYWIETEEESIDKYAYQIVELTYPTNHDLIDLGIYFSSEQTFSYYTYQFLTFCVFNHLYEIESIEHLYYLTIQLNNCDFNSKKQATMIMVRNFSAFNRYQKLIWRTHYVNYGNRHDFKNAFLWLRWRINMNYSYITGKWWILQRRRRGRWIVSYL